jgi:hypothetical protein
VSVSNCVNIGDRHDTDIYYYINYIIIFQIIDLCLYYFLRIMYDFINFESNLKLKTKYCFSINNIHYHGHAILLYELFLTSLNIHALIYTVT